MKGIRLAEVIFRVKSMSHDEDTSRIVVSTRNTAIQQFGDCVFEWKVSCERVSAIEGWFSRAPAFIF